MVIRNVVLIIFGILMISLSNYVWNAKVVATGTIECSIIRGPVVYTSETLVVADCGLRYARLIILPKTNPAQRTNLVPGKKFTCPYEDRYEPLLPFAGDVASNTVRRTLAPCEGWAEYLRNTRS